MRRALFALLFGCALAASPAHSQQQPPAFEPRDETPEMYPDGPNREETFYFCIACHSFRLVAQQGLKRSRWDEVLTWMTERHKMPDVQGEDREKMLDYLSTAFPERQQQRGWKNPFASQ